ncbi:hypothetical protein HW555_002434 [Spodoptera exigua]|uniref:C2H2-type domain-containing protein n=1 Tax=Spodoptera exigua TaxID=7107 RepID=A0A835GRC6_SPOEX|nr:hypothetical protein HW555_002434 [Spodoptera exigua]
MDEAVTHYINSHPADEAVHVDGNALALALVQDDGGNRVSIMHSQSYSSSLCSRQVTLADQVADGQWSEELVDPDGRIGRLAALMAHFQAQQSKGPPGQLQHKVQTMRGDVDTSIMLDNSMRLFHGQPMDHSPDSIVVEVPHLPPLPPLQQMKRCQDSDWFNNKAKSSLKDDSSMIDSDGPVLELGAGASPGHHKHQSKKSLPHKKRISRKLKKNNGNCTPQQDLVVISCADHSQEQEILPDTFVPQDHIPEETHHITHEVRPIFICQLCGEFYGDEQLKFYQHLKQHYEPHIIIENPVPDLGIDKITTSCIVDNVTTIPDSIVELSLENSIPKTMYQPMDKQVLYTTSDKTYTYSNNKVQYSMANMEKDQPSVVQEVEKADLYETLDKLDLYTCGKCNKSFRKQKQCEAHIKEAHSNMKLEDMGEFSEPEDLMEGIHVAVEEPPEHYDHPLLPHLTIENGYAHQDNARHWYGRNTNVTSPSSAPPATSQTSSAPETVPTTGSPCCTTCTTAPQDTQNVKMIKDEILRRILESEIASPNFPNHMLGGAAEAGDTSDAAEADQSAGTGAPAPSPPVEKPPDTKKKQKIFECEQCHRVFQHRNSLLYHVLSHSGKQHVCRECGKGFYTVGALKIHKRVHNGDRPYKCDICGRDFRQWSDLKYHKVSIHSDQKSFKCEFCGKDFARKYSLNVHRRIHTGERNYPCEYCNKTFRASSYRLSHMRTHTGDRPHQCPTCGKAFRVRGDLRRHLTTHDRRPPDKPRPAKQEDPAEDDIKLEVSKTIRKIAVASTAKSSNILKTTDKKPKPIKKNQSAKKGAPNVTIDQLDDSYTNNVDVCDTRQEPQYGKYGAAPAGYKHELAGTRFKEEHENEREFAILRPMFRGGVLCEPPAEPGAALRAENTDGKMHVYTHVEKGGAQLPISDLRPLDRDVRPDLHGESAENEFIERLTALYNIPAV